MRQVMCLVLALTLTSCGSVLFPKTVTLNVVSVSLPASVGAGEPLTVSVRYGVGCGDSEQTVTLAARTSTRLVLSATARSHQPPGTACPAVYVENMLDYTDPGTPARTDPFEVIVNGKSWGTVQIQ